MGYMPQLHHMKIRHNHEEISMRRVLLDMINILMVDDHAIVREGIKRIIDDVPDMQIVAEASCGQEAMELVLGNSYDLVLLDISNPELVVHFL